jgi:hypothetical protein
VIEVWLEPYEMEMCERAGRDRFASARALQRNPGLGWASKGKVQGDIRGAQCEFAASIGLNLSWRPTVGKVDRIDVGDMVEIRSTDLPDGRMPVRPKDLKEIPCVLVQQHGLCHTLIGWIWACDAVKYAPELVTAFGDPAHFVHRDFLDKDMAAFKRNLHWELSGGYKVRLRIIIAPRDPEDAARIADDVGKLLEGDA